VEKWNFIFAGVSAAAAVWSAWSAHESRKARDSTEQMLADGVDAADKVAYGTNVIARAQESRNESDASAQAPNIAIVPSLSPGGQQGWRVENGSGQVVTAVTVHCTTGQIVVHTGSGPKRESEYRDQTILGGKLSTRMFRPADAQGANAEEGEVERMVLRFTDSRDQVWERTGSQNPRRV